MASFHARLTPMQVLGPTLMVSRSMLGVRAGILVHARLIYVGYVWVRTVGDKLFPMRKKTFYQQVLKLGANEVSAQGLQNAV